MGKLHSLVHILFMLLAGTIAVSAKTALENTDLPKRPAKSTVWFYRTGEWIKHYAMQGLDSNYITLPEHSWRVAFTNGFVGIHSTFLAQDIYTKDLPPFDMAIKFQTTPSVKLGFQVGFRTFGFGYSWDALNNYSQNLNFSIGGKAIGIEFMHQRSNNLKGAFHIDSAIEPTSRFGPKDFDNSITNTSLYVWYALNSAHYSHNAAVKQSYIQRKTAGSLLLQVAYMSTRLDLDTILPAVMGHVGGLETHQVGVGLGYGINYTPNQGKVLIHLSGLAQLICFTHNLITEEIDSTGILGLYRIDSRYKVHMTGTMRAAVSWEINKWVHMNVWAQANNIRFQAYASETTISLSDWNWQVNLAVGVRFGAGKKRADHILDLEEAYLNLENPPLPETEEEPKPEKPKRREMKHVELPQWITDYFYSPRP